MLSHQRRQIVFWQVYKRPQTDAVTSAPPDRLLAEVEGEPGNVQQCTHLGSFGLLMVLLLLWQCEVAETDDWPNANRSKHPGIWDCCECSE